MPIFCNADFGKSMENVRHHRGIKVITTDKRRRQLVSQPNYHTKKCFSEQLLAVELKKTAVKMNKAVYLGLAILDISKTLMYEFYYDYLKPKYDDKIKLRYVDTDSFIFNVETEDFYKDISNDVEDRFHTSAYSPEINRPLPKGKNTGKIMTDCRKRLQTYDKVTTYPYGARVGKVIKTELLSKIKKT